MTNKNVNTVNGLVRDLRTVRDQLNADLEKMTPEQRSEYFRQLRAKSHSPQQTLK